MSYTFNPVYYSAVDQIYHAEWASRSLARTEHVRRCIQMLWPDGHPTRFIHVVGTSGKGSVCRYLEAGLSVAHRAGALMSPHLFDLRERFRIGGQAASQEEVVAAWEERIRPLCVDLALAGQAAQNSVSLVCLLISLVLFERHGVEWAAIEAGIGGTYDQTTALPADAVVLTNVGRDHESLLGLREWQRVLDKAGACRPRTDIFTGLPDGADEALAIVAAVCAHQEAPLHRVYQEDVEEVREALAAMFPGGALDGALLSAEHQLRNAALALKVIRHLVPDSAAHEVIRRFGQVRFEGRFQEIAPRVYVDIAHNPDKIEALVAQLLREFPSERKLFVVGLSGDRSARDVFAAVLAVADSIIVTSASFKGVDPEAIARDLAEVNTRRISLEVCPDPAEALALARARQQGDDIVVLTGSTHAIDQALNPDPYLRYLNATWGWRK
jgi:dihydrofolate synthase/folylpolyglutamate synthase